MAMHMACGAGETGGAEAVAVERLVAITKAEMKVPIPIDLK